MTSDNVHNLHKPNRGMIREHLERLFHRARVDYPDCRCEIAWTDARGQITSGNTFLVTPEGLDLAAAEGVMRNEGGVNVYVAVNPHKPDRPPFGRGDAKDVQCAYFQFADIDKAEGIERLRQPLPIPYTMAVTTGRTPGPRVHPYWELEEPTENLEAWRRQQMALRDYFQGDAVIDPPRVMRLAGTVNFPNAKKAGNGYLIEPVTLRTVYDDERSPVSSEAMCHAYPWAQAEYAYSEFGGGAESAGPQPQPGSSDRFDTGRKDPREYVRNIAAGHNLHNNARDLISHLVNTGHRDWLIRELMDRLLRPVSDGGTLGQIDELIRSARQKFNTAEPGPEAEGEDFNAASPLDLYEPLDIEQLAALPPVSYLIDKILTDYGLAVIYGDPASGKTFLALDMALHLAINAPWHDHETTQTGILYIAGEGVRGIAKRVSAWLHHYGLQDIKALPIRFLPHAIDFLDLGDVRKLARTIEHLIGAAETPIGLVVIDTVARNMNGNENDAVDMNRLVSACDELRKKFSLSVIGVHHAGKDSERGMRGSTVLPGGSDTIIEVKRTENVMCVTCRKQKDDEEFATLYMEMIKVPTDPLNAQTSLVLKMLNAEDARPNGNGNNNPTQQQITSIFDEIERAWNANYPWSNAPQTKYTNRYLPNWIAANASATLRDAKSWVHDWLRNGCIEIAECDTRTHQRGLHVLIRPGTYRQT
jgi:hypothetical protein